MAWNKMNIRDWGVEKYFMGSSHDLFYKYLEILILFMNPVCYRTRYLSQICVENVTAAIR